MKVRRFFLRLLPRLGIFVLSVLLLSVLTFYISRLAPGDPLVSYYGDRVEKMSPAEREWAEDKLGLNDPLPRSTPAGSAARCTAISASPINTRWTCWS